MNAAFAVVETAPGPCLEVGQFTSGQPMLLDLEKLLAGRLLIQGSSGAGKSRTLRRIVEEAFEYVTVMIVDPEGEFSGLAAHIGATTLRADEIACEGLTAAALRGRRHRLPLHIDLSDLEPGELIHKAAAFFAGLMGCPTEDWANTVLVVIHEAHLLAPHLAANARDAETRRTGVAALNDLCSRGRKRGIGAVVATPRLATLASSVVATLQNVLIGLNVLDRDVVRAADILGLSAARSDRLRRLSRAILRLRPGAQLDADAGPRRAVGHHPHRLDPGSGGSGRSERRRRARLLELEALQASGAPARSASGQRGARALDAFLIDPAAPAAARIAEVLRRIAPNATTAAELAGHLHLEPEAVNAGLDLLADAGAADTIPRGDGRIARLSARLRLRAIDAPVVSLS